MVSVYKSSSRATSESSLSVTELLTVLVQALQERVPRVAVYGEVSELTKARSGHYYFSLKDPESERGNQIACVMWRSAVTRLSIDLEEGASVVCVAEPTIYEVTGRMQLVVSKIVPMGDGLLQEKFRQLKERLAKEGLFDPERKKQLPFIPRGIGVVTSKSGAAIHDFVVRVRARMPQVPLYVFDARVQGEGSVQEIVRGIETFNKFSEVEVILVTRGGGSLQDLWSFNEELVVRAIGQSSKPVVSAVGHEVDVTLSDLVADLRAPTPTAAAELLVPSRDDLLDSLQHYQIRLRVVPRLVRQLEQRLDDLEVSLGQRSSSYYRQAALRLQVLESQLASIHPQQIIRSLRERIENLQRQLNHSVYTTLSSSREIIGFYARSLSPERLLGLLRLRHENVSQSSARFRRAFGVQYIQAQQRLVTLERELELASPHKILERGFCLVQQNGKPQSRLSELSVPAEIQVVFADGVARGTLTDKLETTED